MVVNDLGGSADGQGSDQGPAAHWRQQRDPQGHFRVINFTSVSGLDGSPGRSRGSTTCWRPAPELGGA